MGPDEELLGVVVHSGLVLGRSDDVVAAVRRITAFPRGLALDTVVLARDIHAQAAGRREHAATAQRRAAETAQQQDEAAAQHDSETAAQRDGMAAADRHHALKQAMIERRYLPSFDQGDLLRLGVATPAGQTQWLGCLRVEQLGNRGPLPAGSHLLADATSGRRTVDPDLFLARGWPAGDPDRSHPSGPGCPGGRDVPHLGSSGSWNRRLSRAGIAQDPSLGAFFVGSTAGVADGPGRPSPSRIDSRRAAPSASMEARSTWSMRASTEVDCSSASPSARA